MSIIQYTSSQLFHIKLFSTEYVNLLYIVYVQCPVQLNMLMKCKCTWVRACIGASLGCTQRSGARSFDRRTFHISAVKNRGAHTHTRTEKHSGVQITSGGVPMDHILHGYYNLVTSFHLIQVLLLSFTRQIYTRVRLTLVVKNIYIFILA